MMKKIKETKARLLTTQPVRVKKYGKTVLLQTIMDRPDEVPEHGPYSKGAVTRGQNNSSLRRTMRTIRELIAENFDGESGRNGLFVTLTFADAELGSDLERIYDAQRKFMMRLKYQLSKIGEQDIVYLTVIEPQPIRSGHEGRFIWHFHILIKWQDNTVLPLTSEYIEHIWGIGRSDVRPVTNYGSISAYLSAYLTTIRTETDDHRKVKASKMPLYPAGVRIFRASRNIVKPKVWEFESKDAALERLGLTDDDLVYVKTYDWSDDFVEGRFTSEYYEIENMNFM
jgi:hypothetical protein